jgi:hypothetical protein
MQFEKQTITIITDLGPKKVIATVGLGSGLAYHKDPRSENSAGFTITAIPSGYLCGYTGTFTSIFNVDAALNEGITQRFIELIADLLDWQQPDGQRLQQQAKEHFASRAVFSQACKEAFQKACEQIAENQTKQGDKHEP